MSEQDTSQEQADRPDWLPEKFDTPEAMAKSYAELESKFSQGQHQEQAEPQAQEPSQLTKTNRLQELSNAYGAQNNSFTDEQYAELQAMGITREMVDDYASSQMVKAEKAQEELMAVAGGREVYEQMAQWAGQVMSEQEREAYNRAVNSGDPEIARMAIENVHAKWKQQTGGKLIKGVPKPTYDAGERYESKAQITADMRNPLYKTDPAFRANVERKISKSNL